MITALLVDDEPYAREELQAQLDTYADIEIIGQAGNALEALREIHKLKPDVVFLDINMPQVSGMELVAMLAPEQLPRVVFVTAYDHYAIQAFEEHAFDYLLKPVDEQRLAKTVERLRQHCQPQQQEQLGKLPLSLVPCFHNHRVKLVKMDEVEYAFSDLGGVHVGTSKGVYHTQLALKLLEQKAGLIRVHRQYLVRPNAISEIALQDNGLAEITTQSGQKLPVSRRHLKHLKELFSLG